MMMFQRIPTNERSVSFARYFGGYLVCGAQASARSKRHDASKATTRRSKRTDGRRPVQPLRAQVLEGSRRHVAARDRENGPRGAGRRSPARSYAARSKNDAGDRRARTDPHRRRPRPTSVDLMPRGLHRPARFEPPAAAKAGKLAGWHPADLAAQVLDALVERTGADPELIDDVILGCVVQIGQQAVNVARNAVLASKLPESVPATSIDRQCGSSQQALHFAAQAVMSGTMDVVIAGGVESMTRVPIGCRPRSPSQNGFGVYKSPAMEVRYPGVEFSQFTGAEMMARKYDLSRDELDAYSYESHRKAMAATRAGSFDDEIVPLEVELPDGSTTMPPHRRRDPLRRDAGRGSRAGAVARRRSHHRGRIESDLRRRVGLSGRQRTRPHRARRRAARAHPPSSA